MKKVILNIPDNKYEFFMELMKNLGFERTEDFDIPEKHKEIVKERIENSVQEELILWDEARKKLKFKSDS